MLWLAACTPSADAPEFTPPGGTYTQPQTVFIHTPSTGASIRYTLDGGTPSETNGTLYDGPLDVSTSVDIRAIAFRDDLQPSPVTTESYTIDAGQQADAPLLDPGSGLYAAPLTVTMTSTTPGSTVYYTTDGSQPTITNGDVYAAPVQITQVGTTQVYAIAYAPLYSASFVAEATYTLAEGQVEAPVFSPPPGDFPGFELVQVSTPTPGATIRYTTDGSFPTCTTGTVYTAPIPVPSGETLSAVGCKTDWIDSALTDGRYDFGQWIASDTLGNLMQSTDRGANWTLSEQALGLVFIDVAADDFGGWVAVDTFGEVRYTTDRGATWGSSTITGLDRVYGVATDGFTNWVAVGASAAGWELRRSADTGAHWSSVVQAPDVPDLRGVATDSLTWIAVGRSGNILRSTNSGNDWVQVADDDYALVDVATDGQGNWVAVGGTDKDVIPYEGHIVVSTDNGLTWSDATFPPAPSTDFFAVSADASGSFVVVGDDGVVRQSLSPTTFVEPLIPTGVIGLNGLDNDGWGRWIAGGTNTTILTSDDAGTNWTVGGSWADAVVTGVAFGF